MGGIGLGRTQNGWCRSWGTGRLAVEAADPAQGTGGRSAAPYTCAVWCCPSGQQHRARNSEGICAGGKNWAPCGACLATGPPGCP
jgi:hypothetical protein